MMMMMNGGNTRYHTLYDITLAISTNSMRDRPTDRQREYAALFTLTLGYKLLSLTPGNDLLVQTALLFKLSCNLR